MSCRLLRHHARLAVRKLAAVIFVRSQASNAPAKLRPWQRDFIKAVYAENKLGLRPVRTAMLSMGR